MKNKNRGWLRVLGLIIPYFITVGIFQIVGLKLLHIDFMNGQHPKTTWQHTVSSCFGLMGTFLVLWLFVKFVDKDRFINLGFHVKNRFKEFRDGFLLGALLLLSGFVILYLLNEIQYDKIVFNAKDFFLEIILFTIVAIVEETLFRGYILKNLLLSFNKYIALIVTSLMFAMLHIPNPNMSIFSFTSLFVAGIFLGVSYIFTRNLWFPIALHFSWNLFQTFLGFNVSGQDLYSIIEFKIIDGNYLNGGSFGFEGSILSLLFQLISLILIFIHFKNKKLANTFK